MLNKFFKNCLAKDVNPINQCVLTMLVAESNEYGNIFSNFIHGYYQLILF